MRTDLLHKSRFLSLILRHKPEEANLKLDNEGWLYITDIVKNTDITFDEIIEIVATNDKKRFIISNNKIRASQGHTITVDLKLQNKHPPPVLYHGSKTSFLISIKKKGLIKGNRNHVHLSSLPEIAKEVAQRRMGKSILIEIDAYAMYNNKFQFFKSENGVWLTDHVPHKYLKYTYIQDGRKTTMGVI